MKKLIGPVLLLAVLLPITAHYSAHDNKGRDWRLTHRGFTIDQWSRFDGNVKWAHEIKRWSSVGTVITRVGDGEMKYTLRVVPECATCSDEECESETTEMCEDADQGTGSGNSQRTQHAVEDGGGCTCTQTCTTGAIAFVDSNDPCGE